MQSHDTVTFLIGIAPHGHVTFISSVFKDSASVRQITDKRGFLEFPSDSIKAGNGFQIQAICTSLCVEVNVPPKEQGERQMLASEAASTKKIAGIRIHVEQKMQCLPSSARNYLTAFAIELGKLYLFVP